METTARDAEILSETVFGVAGIATRLPAEYGANFRVDGTGGRYVLKLPPAGADPLELDLQNAAMLRVANAGIGIDVPRPIPGRDGSLLPPRSDGNGFVRLLSWVEGTPYREAGRPTALAGDVGRVAGAVDTALAGLNHTGADRSLEWDLTAAGETIGLHAGSLSDGRRRTIVERIGARFIGEVRPRLLDLPQQVIHNDINDLNLLVAGDRVSGLIDFGDVLAGVRVIDAAVAATYAMLDQEDPLGVGRMVIAGFDRAAPLAETELSLVYDLIRTRLALSVVMSAARGDPSNPHLSVSEVDAWDLIERLDGVEPAIGVAALAGTAPPELPDLGEIRARVLGPSLSVTYDSPLVIMRGSGTYLFDDHGRRFVDCVNNIGHVGHSHPRVVSAAAAQMATLNTNTRYLHPTILRYAERLTELLPPDLDTCFFVNSGSEANELAIRMARAHTGRESIAVLEHAYHGNTTTLVDVSPYKFEGPGGSGRPPWVSVLPLPDPFRSEFVGPDAAAAYAAAINPTLQKARPAAFIAESIPGVAGQVVPTPGTLAAAFEAAQEVGAVVIADEVQVGFGRTGSAFWGFELADATPDIVTLGKPMGNGHPLGAVVTTGAIAGSFDNGMEYFNSFGGNPVSAAIGMAVLDVIEEEQLQSHSAEVGKRLMEMLAGLGRVDDRVGDVRGAGLFIGVDLVRAGGARSPDPTLAKRLVEHAREHGVLLSTDGPHHNVIKIKPPLVFGHHDAERLTEVIATGLESAARAT